MLPSVTSATITLYKIEETSLYQSELLSSNGTIFHPYDTHTTLTLNVYKGIENITNSFTDIEWIKYSQDSDLYFEDKFWGIDYKDKTSITIEKSEVQKKCIIQANVYMTVNGKRSCVTSSRITLIDVNELYSSDSPPENPADGQLWIDTSKDTPVILSWNQLTNKWTTVGKTTPFVRNLIQNSNFWKLNDYGFGYENPEYLRNIIVTENYNKKWLKLESKIPTDSLDMTAGVFQNTTYPIEKESNYVFSFLAYCVNDTGTLGGSIYVKVSSINSNRETTTLLKKLINIYGDNYSANTCGFTTLSDTESLQVLIGVEPTRLCEMYITELSLYNTSNYYPWELSPEDAQEQLDGKLDNDHLSIFNALTKNGTMEGMFIDTDENGIEHFYFNASHLKAGSIDGGLIDGRGLNIKDKDGQSIFHVYEDEEGQTHIDMIANNLYIGDKKATTEDHVNKSISQLENTAFEKIATDIALSESGIREEIENKSEEAKKEAISYIDDSIIALSNTTEENIQASIQTSTSTSAKYSDDLVHAIQEEIEGELLEKYNEAIAYTNQEVKKISGSLTDDLGSARSEISKEIDDDIAVAKQNTIDYVDSIKKSLQNSINTKANSKDLVSLNESISELDTDLTELTASVATKATKTQVENLSDEVATLTSEVSNLKNTIAGLQDRISTLERSMAKVPCTKIEFNETSYTFEDRIPYQLIATVTPNNTTDTIIWTSSSTMVAAVIDGLIIPIANGECIITATCGSKSAKCNITVEIE